MVKYYKMTAEQFTGGVAFEKSDTGYNIKKEGKLIGSIIEIPYFYKLSILYREEYLEFKTNCKNRAVNIALNLIRYEPEN